MNTMLNIVESVGGTVYSLILRDIYLDRWLLRSEGGWVMIVTSEVEDASETSRASIVVDVVCLLFL